MNAPCIILAGGLGVRLQSILAGRPKCLAPVHGHPFLTWQIRSLAARGIESFVLALGHGSNQVKSYLPSLPSHPHINCVTEPEPLGTGGAVRYAMSHLEALEALVINGDTFLGGSIIEMLRPLNIENGELTRMATVKVKDCERFGGMSINGNNHVTTFIEKGHSGPGLINAGFYRINRAAFNAEDAGSFSLETKILPRLAHNGNLTACAMEGPFIDIGVPDDYNFFCDQHEYFFPKK